MHIQNVRGAEIHMHVSGQTAYRQEDEIEHGRHLHILYLNSDRGTKRLHIKCLNLHLQ